MQKNAVRPVLRRILDEKGTGSFVRYRLACGHTVGVRARVGVNTEGFARCEHCESPEAMERAARPVRL